jgi:hypothetical protein
LYRKLNKYLKVQFSVQWNYKMEVKQMSQEYTRTHLDTRRLTGFLDLIGVLALLTVLTTAVAIAVARAAMSNFIRLLVARIASGTRSCEALAKSARVADEAASLTSCGLIGARRQCPRILRIGCRSSQGRAILAPFALQSSIRPSDEEKLLSR